MTTVLTDAQRDYYKSAGYDYYVCYKHYNDKICCYIHHGLPTTKDALSDHLKFIKSQDFTSLEVIPL